MTDESRTPEPQPPSDHSAGVESDAATVVTVAIVVAVAVVAAVATVAAATASFAVAIAISIGLAALITAGVSTRAFITFIDNLVKGVSRLRRTLRQTGVAAPFAVAVWIGGRSRRWQAEDLQAALAESPRPIRYGLGLVSAAVRMRLRDLSGLLEKAVCWVLATEMRTWTPLTGLLLWGGAETTLDTGLGAAILTVIGAGAVFHTGVTLGRKQLGVEVRRREKAEQPDSPAGP